MPGVVNVNGRTYDEQSASISVFDHGFLYGEGVYETLRTYNGKIFLLDRHMDRLRRSAAQIDLPVPLTDEAFAARLHATLDEAAVGDAPAYLRILLTRGVGPLTYDPSACPTPSLVIIAKPHAEPPATLIESGVTIALVSILRNHPGSLNPLIKSNNLMNNALAMQEGYRKGAYESLMRNHRGELAECSQSNFFLVKDGHVRTPALASGLLSGVTRGFLLELGPAIGIPVSEAVLHEPDLREADEAFFTSTTKEIVPVVRVDEHTIGEGVPGPITRRLIAAFRQKADELTRN